jgi:hypothetical protein
MARTLIVGEHAPDLIGALRALGANGIALQTRDIVRRARESHRGESHMVLFLTERDNIAELRALLSDAQATCLIVAPTSPPRASLARVARQYGCGVCSRADSPAVREAMIVALASTRIDYAAS